MKTKSLLSLMLCGSMLTACAQKTPVETIDIGVNGSQNIEITGGIYGEDQKRAPIISNDPSVAVFPLDGPVENPLTTERYNSVLDNTTAGGYTVFDDSVKVYPLPGDEVPSFVPAYAVPPLKAQYKPEAPMVGQKLTSLTESNLPPVPTVEIGSADPYANPPISGAVRQPLTLTNPEPLAMQAPSDVRGPMLSPFADERGPAVPAEASDDQPRAPMLTTDAPAPMDGGTLTSPAASSVPVPAAPSQGGVTTAGRKSSPMLTGY